VTGKKGFFNWFRPRNDLKELKGHQEKLKTLCPILSLAITTCQAQQRPLKRRKTGSEGGRSDRGEGEEGEEGDGNRQISGQNQGFDAARLLKNDETKHFWLHHFGAKVL
jgi:hypothetical protein